MIDDSIGQIELLLQVTSPQSSENNPTHNHPKFQRSGKKNLKKFLKCYLLKCRPIFLKFYILNNISSHMIMEIITENWFIFEDNIVHNVIEIWQQNSSTWSKIWCKILSWTKSRSCKQKNLTIAYLFETSFGNSDSLWILKLIPFKSLSKSKKLITCGTRRLVLLYILCSKQSIIRN